MSGSKDTPLIPTNGESAKTSEEKKKRKGRGRGVKDTLTQAEIRRLGPMAHVVMRRLLMSAQQTRDPKVAARLFDSVAPYLLSRAPQEYKAEIIHSFKKLVLEEVSPTAFVNGDGQLHADD